MNKKGILLKYWGYDQFRPNQEKIIDTVLSKKDCLAILPTGAGKSLCYQLPGLLQEGITLIVSPLIALMQDQVQQLKDRNIKAMHFSATSHKEESSAARVACVTPPPVRFVAGCCRLQSTQL